VGYEEGTCIPPLVKRADGIDFFFDEGGGESLNSSREPARQQLDLGVVDHSRLYANFSYWSLKTEHIFGTCNSTSFKRVYP
jgi:hypothetical protein